MDRSDKHGLDGARSREKTTGLEWPPWSFVRSVALLQMLFEELRSAVPGVVGIGLVVGGLVLVVEKGVVPSRIDLDLHLLARLLDGRLYPPGDLRAHEAVLLGEEAEHGTGELGVVGLDVWMDAVEVHHGANRRIGAAGEEGELAAHAEADRSELGRGGMAGEVGGRAAQILFRLPDVQRHEELARSVGLAGRLAVVHVGRERGEAGGGEAVAHRLDMGHQPPPFLDHEHPGAFASGRGRQVAIRGMPVARELDHLACHGLSFWLVKCGRLQSGGFAPSRKRSSELPYARWERGRARSAILSRSSELPCARWERGHARSEILSRSSELPCTRWAGT